MAAQRRRPARFDRGHDTSLAVAQMAGMNLAINGTVAAEHIRHLERAAHDGALSRVASPQAVSGRAGWEFWR